jgi:hypothetical protein
VREILLSETAMRLIDRKVTTSSSQLALRWHDLTALPGSKVQQNVFFLSKGPEDNGHDGQRNGYDPVYPEAIGDMPYDLLRDGIVGSVEEAHAEYCLCHSQLK